jgi:hypothetical protein
MLHADVTGGSTVVEHSTIKPVTWGLNPAVAQQQKKKVKMCFT